MPYEERLRQRNLFSPERRRLLANLILAFKIFKVKVDLNQSDFFLRPPRAGLRGHTYRLLQGPGRLRRKSGAFSVLEKKLPAPLVMSPSASVFKKSWTVNGPKSSLQHLCNFCPPFTDSFLHCHCNPSLCIPKLSISCFNIVLNNYNKNKIIIDWA